MVKIQLQFDPSLSGSSENKKTLEQLVNSMAKHEDFISALNDHIRAHIKIKKTAKNFLKNLKLKIQYEEEEEREHIFASSLGKIVFYNRLFWDQAIESWHVELKFLLAIILIHEITHIFIRSDDPNTITPDKVKNMLKAQDSGFFVEQALFSEMDFTDKYGVDLYAEFKPNKKRKSWFEADTEICKCILGKYTKKSWSIRDREWNALNHEYI